jgi:hypothetical protein
VFDKYVHTLDQNTEECPLLLNISKSEDMICNASGLKLLDICRTSELKIVNGRIGDDEGIGRLAYLSSNGKSAIDYAIASLYLFHIISDFIVCT